MLSHQNFSKGNKIVWERREKSKENKLFKELDICKEIRRETSMGMFIES